MGGSSRNHGGKMLRLRFTAADAMQVRMAERPDVLWEILLAAHVLQTQDGPLVFGAWRRHARPRVDGSMRRLIALASARGYSPDFLTPAEASGGLEAGLDAVCRVPVARLREELAQLPPARADLRGVAELAHGSPASLTLLAGGMAAFHRELLAPFWPQIETHLAADRAKRANAVLHGGVDELLATLHPCLEWDPPVLRFTGMDLDRDVHLRGRGLLLIPSFFCWARPTLLRDPDLSPVLVYPVHHDLDWAVRQETEGGARREVAALMGRTRAAVLEATAVGRSTTTLARLVRTSPATASGHLKALREAGLVTTQRHGTSAHHLLSPLGRSLLDATPGGPS